MTGSGAGTMPGAITGAGARTVLYLGLGEGPVLGMSPRLSQWLTYEPDLHRSRE